VGGIARSDRAPDLKSTELKPIEPHAFPQGGLDEEMAKAAKNRPDLTALELAQSAQASAVGAAKSDFGPRVSAYGNWGEDRTSFGGSGGNNWVGGVQVSIDICQLAARGIGAGERGETEDRRASSCHAAASAVRGEPSSHSPADSGTATGNSAGRYGSIG